MRHWCRRWGSNRGDCDNDGDLDLLLTGLAYSDVISRVYRNDGGPANTPPSAPGGLSASVQGDQVTLSWDASSDAETPAVGLSYNLRIGTTPGGDEVTAAMADGASGYRRVPQLGNAQQRTSWTVSLPPGYGSYYWSVQAVDGAWAGGPFAAEEVLNATTAVEEDLPHELSFAVTGANPTGGTMGLRFGLPTSARVELAIYDVAGRRVTRLVSGKLKAGHHTVSWASHERGGQRAAGVYFARLEVDGRVLKRKVVVLQ